MTDPVAEIVETIAASRRYRHVCADVVRRLSADALDRSLGNVREATKRTKRALHQIFGAFLPSVPPYARMSERLKAASGDDEVRACLRGFMDAHASTRERLSVLDAFYSRMLADLPPVQTLLDVACGLNPLAVPWMRPAFAPEAVYSGIEIDGAMVRFLGECLDRLAIRHDLREADLLAGERLPEADVALALKLLPTLEQQRAGSGMALLEALPAPVVIVSFPTRSLGRRDLGFADSYRRQFERQLADRPWRTDKVEFPGELVYRVWKPAA